MNAEVFVDTNVLVYAYDKLIVAAAVRCGATRILSEDLNPGQTIAGIQIENPFLVQ
jgi:predicted nucleic acid-binding protein